jgi:hypothetical protein
MPDQEEIDVFLASYPAEVADLAQAVRRLLEELLPDVEQTLDRSAKVIGFGYGPGYKGMVGALILSKAGVKIGLFRGSELPDPKGLLRGEGKVHRHVPLTSLADLKQPGLKPLIKAALSAWKARNKAEGSSGKS